VSVLETAVPADLASIRGLLEAAGLPTSDLVSARPEFVLVREGTTVVAAGALQRFGSAALLRSVVVAENARNRGLGRQVVRQLEQLAQGEKIEQLVLLTETASAFFRREGYRTIERSAAPLQVQESTEFRSLCPSSATCMSKTLS
jgi:amino-acid N-acetyltransferase